MKILLLLFLFLVPFSFSQKKNAVIVCNQAKKEISSVSSDKVNDRLLSFLQELKGADFVSPQEYGKFLEDAGTLIRKNSPKEAHVLFHIGKALYGIKFQLEAYPFLFRTGEIIEQKNEQFDFKCEYYEAMGGSYYYFRRFEDAEKAFLKGIDCDESSDGSKINMYNTLGLIYSFQNDLKTSEKYFRTALNLAKKVNNDAWYGVIIGNLGKLYYDLNDQEKAIEYLELDFESSVKHKEFGSAINAFTLIVQIDLENNNLKAAAKRINKLDSLVLFVDKGSIPTSYFYAKTTFLEKTKNFEQALIYYRKYVHLQDSLAASRSLVNFNNTEFQIQFEKKQSEIKLLETVQRADKTRINGLYIIALVIFLGAIVIIWQIAKRRKREKEILELKNQRMEYNLEQAKQELSGVLKNLIDKNETVLSLSDELFSLQESKNEKSDTEKSELSDRLHSFTLLTDEDWMNFKRLFEKLHPGFFEYFQNNYEEITNAEVRLAALIKLNLENLEMSKALGISPDSVRKTNLRLRKRLDIAEQKDLQKMIFSI